jgi:hypothetical protein
VAGLCDLNGRTTMLEPYQLMIEGRDYQSQASGTCKGTLNGKPYDGPAQGYIDGRMSKPMSCEVGGSDNVPGILYLGSGSPNDVGSEGATLQDCAGSGLTSSDINIKTQTITELYG